MDRIFTRPSCPARTGLYPATGSVAAAEHRTGSVTTSSVVLLLGGPLLPALVALRHEVRRTLAAE